MQYCKTVTLRTRPIKNGMLSFYLDYYPGYRDSAMSHWESTSMQTLRTNEKRSLTRS